MYNNIKVVRYSIHIYNVYVCITCSGPVTFIVYFIYRSPVYIVLKQCSFSIFYMVRILPPRRVTRLYYYIGTLYNVMT